MRLKSSIAHHALNFICVAIFVYAVSFSANAIAFYDPFEQPDAISPSDELETRLWDESKRLKPQLLRNEHVAVLKPATQYVNSFFAKEFPGLEQVFKLHVYKESELATVTTPHGEIFLSSGLLLRIHDEHELTAILVREMAHVYQRDSARTLSYARTGANLKELFSTAFAFYNLAAGISSMSSMANSLTGISPEMLANQLQLTPDKLIQESGKLLANSLKDRLKEDLNDLGRNLGGAMVHKLSVQALAALVKTSLYGYSDRIEREADLFALSYLQERYGQVDAFDRLMTRLHAQANADGPIPYLSFYSNAERMQARLDTIAEWKNQRPALNPLAVRLANFVNLPKGTVTIEEPVAQLPQLVDSSEVVSSSAPGSAVEYVSSKEPAKSEHIFLADDSLKNFLLQSLSQESRDGAPGRFLENLASLIDRGVVHAKDAVPSQVQAFKKTRSADQKQKAIQLLLEQIQTGESQWKAHQMVADLYLELNAFPEAIDHYEQALAIAKDDEYAPFLVDKKRKAETLMKKGQNTQ